jgi:hypothetical protein
MAKQAQLGIPNSSLNAVRRPLNAVPAAPFYAKRTQFSQGPQ